MKLHRTAFVLAILCLMSLAAGITNADPLQFGNTVALQNGGSTSVDLFSHPGTTLLGSHLTFTVDVTGVLGAGAVDTLRITYNELGGIPIVQDYQIPVFDTIQPPFTLVYTFISPGVNLQGISVTMTIDLLNSSPDFIIPGGSNQGQRVNSYTYSFYVAQPVPEPATLMAFASGVGAFAFRRRRGK